MDEEGAKEEKSRSGSNIPHGKDLQRCIMVHMELDKQQVSPLGKRLLLSFFSQVCFVSDQADCLTILKQTLQISP